MRKSQYSVAGENEGVGVLVVQVEMLSLRRAGPSQQPRATVSGFSLLRDVPRGIIPAIYSCAVLSIFIKTLLSRIEGRDLWDLPSQAQVMPFVR